ncbi:MAG: type II toxin-antitoxin system VapC family toxin [Acidobacteriota bacterium]
MPQAFSGSPSPLGSGSPQRGQGGPLNLYAETSAVVAWWLGEVRAADVQNPLAAAEVVITSELTLVECERVLARASALKEIGEAEVSDRRAWLRGAVSKWSVIRLDAGILERAKRTFPEEPLRTLDALHLASALSARSSAPGLVILSLDERVRRNAKSLGFALLPAARRGSKS